MVKVATALACSLFVASLANAQSPDARASEAASAQPAAIFASPVRVMAGSKPMGVGRLYPSPVFRDMNGDGLADVVIGDLFGRITVATRIAGDGPPAWGAEVPLEAVDGKELKFSNW
ncbi:MAG TPA: hypothetical protein VMS76_07345 [Planctomycetota bacterium]|nr:hypothetical protein [Planctomycetota bacterium]